VGESTTSGYGYRIDNVIVLAMLRIDLIAPNTKLDVEIFGERYAATVQPDAPLYDPTNDRIRA
jgi:dimethylglycine dehydrogenase